MYFNPNLIISDGILHISEKSKCEMLLHCSPSCYSALSRVELTGEASGRFEGRKLVLLRGMMNFLSDAPIGSLGHIAKA